jgi:hypothetical protein
MSIRSARMRDELIVRQMRRLPPAMDMAAKAPGQIVFNPCVRIDHHFEWLRVVVNDHAAKRVSRSLMPEMSADISNAQSAVGIRLVGMCNAIEQVIISRSPCRPLSLQLFVRHIGVEVQREDEARVGIGIIRIERQRAPQVTCRLFG